MRLTSSMPSMYFASCSYHFGTSNDFAKSQWWLATNVDGWLIMLILPATSVTEMLPCYSSITERKQHQISKEEHSRTMNLSTSIIWIYLSHQESHPAYSSGILLSPKGTCTSKCAKIFKVTPWESGMKRPLIEGQKITLKNLDEPCWQMLIDVFQEILNCRTITPRPWLSMAAWPPKGALYIAWWPCDLVQHGLFPLAGHVWPQIPWNHWPPPIHHPLES